VTIRKKRDSIGPDGLVLPDVGEWAETKYRLVEIYAQLFTTAMKGKWKSLAYVDLFAAAGLGRVRGTNRIVPGTAVCALRTPTPFDRHVLVEMDSVRLDALKTRVQREFAKSDVRFLRGDSNEIVDLVIDELPGQGRTGSVLTFCVVDPNRIADLRFSTIERLASIDATSRRPIDFLVLIPSFMDARRERSYYLKPSNTALSAFLGNAGWRNEWARTTKGRKQADFGVFVVDAFGRSMQKLGYLWDIEDAIVVGDGKKELYHLAFFSRHTLGRKFAREARKYATRQLGFQW
jgi:three-Cys-motif partner protein